MRLCEPEGYPSCASDPPETHPHSASASQQAVSDSCQQDAVAGCAAKDHPQLSDVYALPRLPHLFYDDCGDDCDAHEMGLMQELHEDDCDWSELLAQEPSCAALEHVQACSLNDRTVVLSFPGAPCVSHDSAVPAYLQAMPYSTPATLGSECGVTAGQQGLTSLTATPSQPGLNSNTHTSSSSACNGSSGTLTSTATGARCEGRKMCHSKATAADAASPQPVSKVSKLSKASSPQTDAQHAQLLRASYEAAARTDSPVATRDLTAVGTNVPAPRATAPDASLLSPQLQTLPAPPPPPPVTMPQDALLASLRVQMALTRAALLHVRQMRLQLGEVDPSAPSPMGV